MSYAGLNGLQPPHGMMPRCFDLEMEGRHVVEEPCIHEVVRVGAGRCAVLGRAVEEAPDGPHGLQEGRHAELVTRCRHQLPPVRTGPRQCSANPARLRRTKPSIPDAAGLALPMQTDCFREAPMSPKGRNRPVNFPPLRRLPHREGGDSGGAARYDCLAVADRRRCSRVARARKARLDAHRCDVYTC
jgi:hypothetical protein